MTPADYPSHARTMELLWGLRAPSTRGPKASFNLEDITKTAIRVADHEGLPAVSMQRLADELGFTKMALYRHVPGKEQLVAAMVDVAVGPPPRLGKAGSGWQALLTEWATVMFDIFVRHQWLLDATIGPRVMGPNELAWFDKAVSALEATGLDGGERLDVVAVVSGHIRTIAQQTKPPPDGSPITQEQFIEPIAEIMRTHGERYPAIASALASPRLEPRQGDALKFGLDLIFDGLRLLIEARSVPSGA